MLVAGAALRVILRDSRSAKRCIFRTERVSEMGQVRSPKRRVRDDDFLCSDYRRNVVESSLYWREQFMNSKFRGRHNNIWWCWRVTVVAPPIVLDVSCVTRINHPSHFSWQGQYLVKLECASCCSAHCTGPFTWNKDQSSGSIFVAGAILGEAGRQLMVALRVALDVSCTNPTSPYFVPATTKGSRDWSLSHMKRPVQCAQHQDSSSNSTKYCTCHEFWSSRFQRQIPELCITISSTLV